MARPDFLPVTVMLISRDRERRSVKEFFLPDMSTPALVKWLQLLTRAFEFYCLSKTTTAFAFCPCSLLPSSVHVRFFPSLETVQVMVLVT